MASSVSTATSSWPPRMCIWLWTLRCQDIQICQNPGRAYYVCPSRTRCVAWVGWCDEFRSDRFATDHPHNVFDMGLWADIVRIDQSLCMLRTVVDVLCVVVLVVLFRM